MIKRKITAFIIAGLVWTSAVALGGAASLPRRGWPYVLTHPSWYLPLGELWVLIPLVFAILFVAGPAGLLEDFFNRLRKGPLQPDRRPWAERLTVFFGLYMAAIQTFETVGLALYWRVPAYAAAVNAGPHLFGLPDPGHWLERFPCIAVGLLVAWWGNSLPKLLSPFKGEAEPYNWSRMIRDCGWVLTLGGLASAVCVIVLSFPRGYYAGSAVLLASLLIGGLIWAVHRIAGRPDHQTPPGRTP